MKKRILVPTDFSKNATNAIAYVVELFKDQQVEFYVLNTYFSLGYSTDNLSIPEPSSDVLQSLKNTSEKKMEGLKVQLKFEDEYPDHTYHFMCEFGPLVEVIKNTVEKNDIELIAIGSRGETDDENYNFGRSSAEIMEKVRNCPVFMVPANVSFKKPNEIVFPTSFKTHYKRRELNYLYEIANITNAPIRILHISKEKELSKEQNEKKALLESCFEGLKYSFHTLENTDVQTGLNIFTQSRNSEMIAFINKKHSFFGSIFSRPLVKDLGLNAKVPVLALHDFRN
ncbi:MAG: universal stress protein UspA [Flavobacteriaceae bacterium]|nr:universal stress protein UspA [Flavobacteriaceae bacterium]|tara:strand:+ start:952 stop:1803 length:852 start_codon:yes stop_codon:yes gene_type:complete